MLIERFAEITKFLRNGEFQANSNLRFWQPLASNAGSLRVVEITSNPCIFRDSTTILNVRHYALGFEMMAACESSACRAEFEKNLESGDSPSTNCQFLSLMSELNWHGKFAVNSHVVDNLPWFKLGGSGQFRIQ